MASILKDRPPHYYTMEEYFALERAGEARYEYWDGEIICMSGGSRQYARICGNVYLIIGQQIRGSNCTAYTGDLAIRTPTPPPYRYPDASVACGTLQFENINGIDALINPVLIVEVLSPGTESLDKKEKRLAYQRIPSVMELLLIAQDAPHVTQIVRQPEQEPDWGRRDYGDLTVRIELSSIGCPLSLSDIYEGVDFS